MVNLSKYEPSDLLVVYWLDTLDVSTWLSDDIAQIQKLVNAVSVGWYINHDKKCLRISHCVAGDGEKSVIVIPIGCIEKVVKVIYNRRGS